MLEAEMTGHRQASGISSLLLLGFPNFALTLFTEHSPKYKVPLEGPPVIGKYWFL